LTEFKYKNPPILEAFCEIFFAGSEWDDTIPGSFYQRVQGTYPDKQQLTSFGVTFLFAPQGQVNAQGRSDKNLMRFIKHDKSQLIQLAENLLTVNQLQPYCGYQQFQSDIDKAIKEYISIAAPKKVERIGVRYVNQIIIPSDNFDLSEYLKLLPGVPEDVATAITGFTTRVSLVARHPDHQIYVTLSNATPISEGSTTLILDLYDTLQVHNDANVESILKAVTEAHDNIGHVFEGVITDKARELFGEIKHEHSSK
jgi:uncharacterized protein (TIGR04255 family)